MGWKTSRCDVSLILPAPLQHRFTKSRFCSNHSSGLRPLPCRGTIKCICHLSWARIRYIGRSKTIIFETKCITPRQRQNLTRTHSLNVFTGKTGFLDFYIQSSPDCKSLSNVKVPLRQLYSGFCKTVAWTEESSSVLVKQILKPLLGRLPHFRMSPRPRSDSGGTNLTGLVLPDTGTRGPNADRHDMDTHLSTRLD